MSDILIALLVLMVLVFVHELGHFLAAKACGVYVDRFSIGMPPRLFGFKCRFDQPVDQLDDGGRSLGGTLSVLRHLAPGSIFLLETGFNFRQGRSTAGGLRLPGKERRDDLGRHEPDPGRVSTTRGLHRVHCLEVERIAQQEPLP